MSRIPFVILSFLDLVAFVVRTDFVLKWEEMCDFSTSVAPLLFKQATDQRAQQIHRQSALQTSQKENYNRIPFTLTFHPHNYAV